MAHFTFIQWKKQYDYHLFDRKNVNHFIRLVKMTASSCRLLTALISPTENTALLQTLC